MVHFLVTNFLSYYPPKNITFELVMPNSSPSTSSSTSSDHLTDRQLVAEIVGGNAQLLNVLYERYSSKVYYKCLSITKNKDSAKDLSHDILIKVFTNLHKYKGTADFSFWIYAITYNTCMTALRKAKRTLVEELVETADAIDLSEIDINEKILLELRLNHLKVLLKQLNADDRLLLLMRYQDGMSVKQIGEVLQLQESAVKMRLKRSRDRLATLFKALRNE